MRIAFKATITLEQIIKGRRVGITTDPHKTSPFLAPSKAKDGKRSNRIKAATESRRKKDFFMYT